MNSFADKLTLITPKLGKQVLSIGASQVIISIVLIIVGAVSIGHIQQAIALHLAIFFGIVSLLFLLINVLLIMLIRKSLASSTEQEIHRYQTLHDYKRSTMQLQAAAEIARDATSESRLQDLLDRTVQLICERFGYYHAGIFLIDEATQYAVLRSATGSSASKTLLNQNHQLKVGAEGIVGYVTGTGNPRIVLDTDEDTYHYKNPVLPETLSELTLPFRVGKRIIGALDVQSTIRGAFDQEDVNILQTMADLLAVAIDKARLNETVLAYADELEIRVEQRTQELVSERAQLQAILDSMGDGVIYDENLKSIYINDALMKLTGYQRHEWQGLLEPIKPQSMSDEQLNDIHKELYEAVGHQGIWKLETKLMRKDGSEFDASILCTAVQRNEETNIAKGAVTIIRDISQHKALDEQKSRFIANAAHELRTPLANMKTRLYLIKRQPERFTEHFEVLRKVTGRMQRLIDDLLDMSRFERGKIQLNRQKVLLQDLIQDIMNIQRAEADQKSIRLIDNLDEVPVYAFIDEGRIVQVLTNLVTNAVNYTPEDGSIIIHLTTEEDHARICVEDTGIGISEEMIENVFQPFFRVHHDTTKGTGLGLNIAQEIVRLHGGDMWVESIVGKGSKFYVVLAQSNEAVPHS